MLNTIESTLGLDAYQCDRYCDLYYEPVEILHGLVVIRLRVTRDVFGRLRRFSQCTETLHLHLAVLEKDKMSASRAFCRNTDIRTRWMYSFGEVSTYQP